MLLDVKVVVYRRALPENINQEYYLRWHYLEDGPVKDAFKDFKINNRADIVDKFTKIKNCYSNPCDPQYYDDYCTLVIEKETL